MHVEIAKNSSRNQSPEIYFSVATCSSIGVKGRNCTGILTSRGGWAKRQSMGKAPLAYPPTVGFGRLALRPPARFAHRPAWADSLLSLKFPCSGQDVRYQ